MTPSPKDPLAPDGRSPDDGSQGPSFRLLASEHREKGRAFPFAVSAVVHLLLIGLIASLAPKSVRILSNVLDFTPLLLVDDNPPPIETPEPREAAEPPAARGREGEPERTRTAPPRVTPSVAEEAPVTPLTAPTEIPRTIAPPAGGGGNVAEGGRSAGERFSGAAQNPLLFAPPAGQPPAAAGPAAARARLADRVREINDSIMAEQLAAERATDWTFTDKDGKRWGISPGKLHLGDVTIPLGQSAFTPGPGRRDEFNALVRNWNEIEQQASRAVVTDNIKDRVKAIRERKDKEREAKKKKPVATGS